MTKKIISVLFPLILCVSGLQAQMPEDNLKNLGVTLPVVSNPIANYVHSVRVGNLLFLSGKGPRNTKGEYIKGKLGKDMTVEEGAEAAKLAAIEHIAVLKHELGDLSKVKRIVKVLGMVNSTDTFAEHPKVINGYSDFMVAIFGDKGRHARSAVGHNSLPMGMAVEVEVVVEVED